MAGLFSKILTKFKRDEIDWDELEETLIGADLGIRMTTRIIDALQERGKGIKADDITTVCREEILKLLPDEPVEFTTLPDRPVVILVVGVNGTGKTTSVAKLAGILQRYGLSVMLAAADTFRAAAIEQLEVWAGRLDIPLIKGAYKADPSSICFSAYDSAQKNGTDFLLCDTAGRLHTRHNLMQELGKIERTLQKKDPTAPHESYIVVDATTGSNALVQAREFQGALGNLSGVIVTKLDGSGKGGIIVSIQDQLGIPTKFVGTGERIDDFAPFERTHFVNEIL